MSETLLGIARAYVAAGLSIIPIAADGSKAPEGRLLPRELDPVDGQRKATWRPFQERPPTDAELVRWFGREGRGLAVLGGVVSGGLEIIDVDDADLWAEFSDLVEDLAPGLIGRLPLVRTPRGYHLYYRCAEVAGNDKLARRPPTEEEVARNPRAQAASLIETRGEGGYVLAPGCPPECHPSGSLYVLQDGPTLDLVPTITEAERALLLTAGRSLDRLAEPALPDDRRQASGDAGLQPGTDFNRRGDWNQILEPHGWTLARSRGDVGYWRRPGKDRCWSATTGYCRDKEGNPLLHVFTSSTAFAPGTYSRFAAVAVLEHSGDFKAAAKALAARGYGERRAERNGKRHANGHTNGQAHATDTPAEDRPPLGLTTTRLDRIQPAPVRWLVPGYLPLGKLVLIAGDGGHGKSTLTLDLAAAITRGRPAFGLTYDPPPAGDVLLISCEDDYGDTVVPRFLAAGGDRQRAHRVDGTEVEDGKTTHFSLAHYLQLEVELRRRPSVRLVVIDPAGAYIGAAGVDDHKDSELRSLLGPLAELAAQYRVTVLLVKHLNKGLTSKAVHKVGGSAGYVNSVRAAFLVLPDDDNARRKYFLPIKFNVGPRPSGLAYELAGLHQDFLDPLLTSFVHLEEEDRDRLGRQLFEVAWQGEVAFDADTLLSQSASHQRDTTKDAERAADWLDEYLAVRPVESARCVADGNRALGTAHDLKWWRETVLKARLQGRPRKTGGVGSGRWWFTLPVHPWPFPQLEEGEEGEEAEQPSSTLPWPSS